jgi:hypothetical protein
MVRLAQRAGTPKIRHLAEQAIAALSGIAAATPTSGASILTAADSFLHGQQGVKQFAGNGVVSAKVVASADRKSLLVHLQVAQGWHINSHEPLQDYLVATKLNIPGNENAEIAYPEPGTKKLKFNDKPMALLENEVKLTASFDTAITGPVEAQLQVQTCSDEICLLPQTLKLRVAVPVTD